MTVLRRAYYSLTAAKKYRSSIYRKADGTKVKITYVELALKNTGVYGWSDAIAVVPVTDFIRKGRTECFSQKDWQLNNLV